MQVGQLSQGLLYLVLQQLSIDGVLTMYLYYGPS